MVKVNKTLIEVFSRCVGEADGLVSFFDFFGLILG